MKYVLYEATSKLFVGSHSPKHAQLQELDHAYVFDSYEEAMASKVMITMADFEIREYDAHTL